MSSLGCLNSRQIDGLLWLKPSKEGLQYLAPQLKGISVYRKPDEWVYSAFNFWCLPGYDKGCRMRYGWTTKEHKRSPQIFHEILTSPECENLFSPRCILMKPRYVESYLWYENILGRDNMIVLSTEELYHDGFQVMSEVFTRLGLEPFGNSSTYMEAINVNAKKGAESLAPYAEGLGKTVQPMLPESRRILREKIQFHHLKLKLSNVTGHYFHWL